MKNNISRQIILMACSGFLFLSACSETDKSTAQPAAIKQGTNEEASTEAPLTTSSHDEAVKEAETALEFTLTDLDGNLVNAKDYRGKWLVLNYWATWCGPCRDEMPELVKFQAENDHVQVLGIAYEDADVQKLKNFAEDFNITYPLLTIDVYNPPEFAVEGGMGLPTTIVYNPEGLRHKKHMGPIDFAGLLEMLK